MPRRGVSPSGRKATPALSPASTNREQAHPRNPNAQRAGSRALAPAPNAPGPQSLPLPSIRLGTNQRLTRPTSRGGERLSRDGAALSASQGQSRRLGNEGMRAEHLHLNGLRSLDFLLHIRRTSGAFTDPAVGASSP